MIEFRGTLLVSSFFFKKKKTMIPESAAHQGMLKHIQVVAFLRCLVCWRQSHYRPCAPFAQAMKLTINLILLLLKVSMKRLYQFLEVLRVHAMDLYEDGY